MNKDNARGLETPQPPSETDMIQKAADDIEKQYNDTVERESNEQMEKEIQNSNARFEELRKLGFVTTSQVDERWNDTAVKIKKLEADITKLREFLIRKKAQGNIEIPPEKTEDQKKNEDLKELYGNAAELAGL